MNNSYDEAQLNWLLSVVARDETDSSIQTIVAGMHEALPDSLSANHSMCGSSPGITALTEQASCHSIVLEKNFGETTIVGAKEPGLPVWHWRRVRADDACLYRNVREHELVSKESPSTQDFFASERSFRLKAGCPLPH